LILVSNTFDKAPTSLSMSAGTLTTQAGQTATIPGPFTPGCLSLKLTWAAGVQTLTYTVKAPSPPLPRLAWC